MALVANERLRWGDGFIEPGGLVPEGEAGRDYPGLIRLGQATEVVGDDHVQAELAKVTEERDALKKRVAELEAGEPDDDEIEIPEGVIPGETPGWPLGTFVIPLSDEHRALLADADISGTLSHEDLVGLLEPVAGQDELTPEPDQDALPEGVTAQGGGWYLLPDGTTKVHGRQALADALK